MAAMERRSFTVTFLTPAFLGDAAQAGCWRSPPFKHLLREWWRVAWAAGRAPGDWREMRRCEGQLLGHAWLDAGKGEDEVNARQSAVRLRLEPWAPGTLARMPRTEPAGPGRAPPSTLYLGYGPVRSATELKMTHPVDAGAEARLSVAFPESAPGAGLIEPALRLAHAWGAIGGRARNGWGSLHLEGPEGAPEAALEPYVRDWRQCLEAEWAHAIGKDERGPLVWRTRSPAREWKTVIERLARVRKAVNGSARGPTERQILNQPVAGKGARVPSNLRFKVRRAPDGGLHGYVFHMPHLPPPLRSDARGRAQVGTRGAAEVWTRVHALLDGDQSLTRVKE